MSDGENGAVRSSVTIESLVVDSNADVMLSLPLFSAAVMVDSPLNVIAGRETRRAAAAIAPAGAGCGGNDDEDSGGTVVVGGDGSLSATASAAGSLYWSPNEELALSSRSLAQACVLVVASAPVVAAVGLASTMRFTGVHGSSTSTTTVGRFAPFSGVSEMCSCKLRCSPSWSTLSSWWSPRSPAARFLSTRSEGQRSDDGTSRRKRSATATVPPMPIVSVTPTMRPVAKFGELGLPPLAKANKDDILTSRSGKFAK